jgi:uncharacterized cupredoxin-like copper-binding protein
MIRLTGVTLLGITLLLGSTLAVACGDDDEDATGTPAAGTAAAGQGGSDADEATVAARLAEYSIRLDKTSAPEGEVTFKLENAGTIPHEFVVLKTDLAEASLPVDSETSTVDEEASGIETIDEAEEFPAGESETLEVDLEPGNYVFICNVAGHYQLGMHASFTVR